jgi:secreted trypsin-like serine protease
MPKCNHESSVDSKPILVNFHILVRLSWIHSFFQTQKQ